MSHPVKKSRVRQSKETWRNSIEEELKTAGTAWVAVKKAAENRVCWRAVAEALSASKTPTSLA